MKIVHFADAHIGVTTHGRIDPTTGVNDRVLDFLDAFDFIIDCIEQEQVDLVLFAGDMFHTNTPSPSLVSEVSLRIQEISKLCPIIMIPGNHDQALNRVSALNYLSVLDLPNVYINDKPCHYVIDGVLIGAVPYPTYSAYNIVKTAQNANLELISAIYETMDEWLAMDYWVRILLFHGTLEGAQWGGYSSVALGHEAHVHPDYLNDWDYVALGHIHLHQANGNIVYPGSIERVDFGEALEDKGFVLINVEDGSLEWEFVTIPARPMAALTINLTDIEPKHYHKEIGARISVANIHPDSLVKVRIIINQLKEPNIDFIYKLLRNVYRVCDVSIIRERTISERTELLPANVAELQHDQLLEEWLILQDASDEDVDAVLELFYDIEEEIHDAN